MHEYTLMKNIISNILGQLKEKPLQSGENIKEVILKVGALDIHSEESFLQAFSMLVKDTSLEKCALQLSIEPGSLKCNKCGFEGPCPTDKGDGHDPIPVTECPKCGNITHIIGGRGVQMIELVTAA